MLEDDERLQLVVQLEEILIATGYGPLVDQHRNAVAEGRFVEVRAEDIEKSGRRARPNQPKVGDVRRVELSPEEQLSRLLDLVEVAVGGTLAIEERTLEMAREFTDGDEVVAVVFLPDIAQGQGSEQPTPDSSPSVRELGGWALEPDSLERRGAVAQVLETVHHVREVAGLDRARWLEPQVDRRTPGERTLGGW